MYTFFNTNDATVAPCPHIPLNQYFFHNIWLGPTLGQCTSLKVIQGSSVKYHPLYTCIFTSWPLKHSARFQPNLVWIYLVGIWIILVDTEGKRQWSDGLFVTVLRINFICFAKFKIWFSKFLVFHHITVVCSVTVHLK